MDSGIFGFHGNLEFFFKTWIGHVSKFGTATLDFLVNAWKLSSAGINALGTKIRPALSCIEMGGAAEGPSHCLGR